MRQARTYDERGLARLKYAIGRRNSFEECWALTQYWRGECITTQVSPADREGWDEYDDEIYKTYEFLFDYEAKAEAALCRARWHGHPLSRASPP